MTLHQQIQDDPDRICLARLALDSLTEHGGDVKLAIGALVSKLKNEGHLLKEVVADASYAASERAVSKVNRDVRHNLFNRHHRQSQGRDNVIALARGIGASLLDFPLKDGTQLRNATPAQVQSYIEHCEAQGANLLHKARWLRHVCQGVPADELIGNVVTDARASELWESTANA